MTWVRPIIVLPMTFAALACAARPAPDHRAMFDATSMLSDVSVAARAGDKRAQLELGKWYEEGHGVARDLHRAKKLYRAAASDTPDKTWIFVPQAGSTPGAVMAVTPGTRAAGLIEAQARLCALASHPLRCSVEQVLPK